jgi:hypothetical protein
MKLINKTVQWEYKEHSVFTAYDPYLGFEITIRRMRDNELMYYGKYEEVKSPEYVANMIDSYKGLE